MQHFRNEWLGSASRAGLAVLLAVLGGTGSAWAQRPFRDPVEGLRKALLFKAETARDKKERTASIAKYARQLQSIGDLRRALALPGWRNADPTLQVEIASRFTQKIHDALQSSDALTRLAAADLLADIGSTIVSPDTEDQGVFTRRFTPDLVKMVNADPNQRVRAAAARALGKVHGGPKEEWRTKDKKAILEIVPSEAVPALKRLLSPSKAVVLRRAAAEGLFYMVRGIVRGTKVGGYYTGIEALLVCLEVVPVASEGLQDGDAVVRRWSVKAIRNAALVLGELPRPAFDRVPEDLVIKSLDRNAEDYDKQRTTFREKADELADKLRQDKSLELARAFAKEGPTLAKLLNDPDRRVRSQVRHTLIDLAQARRNLLSPVEVVPYLEEKDKKKKATKEEIRTITWQGTAAEVQLAGHAQMVQAERRAKRTPETELLEGMEPSLKVLARGLTDPRAQARLDALLFLQLLGHAAEPAKYALVRAMADPNPFVRWAAARTLGTTRPRTEENAPPPIAKLAIPALAKLLQDPDIDLRLAAARTLELYGPEAAPAVDTLICTLQAGDPEIRIAAMKTLLSVGRPGLKAIPALITLLESTDAQLRQAAAETLGRFGPPARSASSALRKLLDDSEPDVRKAASEALLNITLGEK